MLGVYFELEELHNAVDLVGVSPPLVDSSKKKRTYADCSSNLSLEFQPTPAPVDSKKYRKKLPAIRMSQN